MIDLKWWFSRKKENVTMWIARHLPRDVRKWVIVLAAVNFCGDTKHPDEAKYPDLYKAA